MKRFAALMWVAVAVAGAAAAPTGAAEVSRGEYVERVEPVCRANTEANERIFRGVRAEVRKGKLKPAATRFARAATALRKTLAQLRRIQPPPADRTTLKRWFGYVRTEAELFAITARDLRQGKRGAAARMVARLTHTADVANATVLDFEFHYCRFNASKFL